MLGSEVVMTKVGWNGADIYRLRDISQGELQLLQFVVYVFQTVSGAAKAEVISEGNTDARFGELE